MENKINELSYSARTVVRQAGRVLSPEPQQDSPLTTGRKPKQKINTSSNSGKSNKTTDYVTRQTSRTGRCGRKMTKKSPLIILHFNICGLSTKKDEFKNFLHKNNIHVALLQETQHAHFTTQGQ